MILTRRKMIKDLSIVASALPILGGSVASFMSCSNDKYEEAKLDISIFSKHLQFLDYHTTGAMAAELGFDGVDLTVRPKGHVLPESVAQDLPLAIEAIKKAGSSCQMITTSIQSVHNPLDLDIIKTAAQCDVQYYRTHWYKYKEDQSMEERLAQLQIEIKHLGEYNKQHDIMGVYQNHAGTSVGASYWEINEILKTVDTEYFGTQYDIRHAIAEGGLSWKNGLQLLQKHIKTIVLKDFKWGQINGKWKPINVPIGEGMVDFTSYFKLLKKYKINVPVSLHLEYDLGGAEKGHYDISIDKKVVFDAMTRDLVAIRKLWANA